MTAPSDSRSTQGGGNPSAWDVVKFLAIPIIGVAVIWGGNQVSLKAMATREEVSAIRSSLDLQTRQTQTLIEKVQRLTCRLYPQSYECPDKMLQGEAPSAAPTISERRPR